MKTLKFITVILITLGSAFVTICHAESDVKKSKDYPLVQRWPLSHINDYSDTDFDAFEFATPDKATHVEGRTIRICYGFDRSTELPSNLKFVRNFQNALKKGGWTLLTSPDDTSRVVANLIKDGKEIWIQISPSTPIYYEIIVEKTEMKQEVSANDLLDKLNSEGHLALEIHFDTAKAAIKTESQPIIEKMVEMLKSDPALKVEVQGHTDNRGDPQADQLLSEQRASAVVKALVDGGIDSSRLVAKGYGRSKPVADNDTEEGRTKNRRVELVKL